MVFTPTRERQFPLREIRHAKLNPPKDMQPSFVGQTVIVTGANTGIGLEAAVKFVSMGATKVVLGVRTIAKGEHAKLEIEQRTERFGVVDVWLLDMLDYDSIKDFAMRASNDLQQLDVVILNAGVFVALHQVSCYGFEHTIQVNTISTTLLSLLLLPKLRASKTVDSTPVLELVSSGMHRIIDPLATDGDASLLEIYSRPSVFNTQTNYNVSKLLLEHAHQELTRLALSQPDGTPDVIVISVCPGATESDLARDYSSPLMRLGKYLFSRFLQRTTEEGARLYISGTQQGKNGHGAFWTDDEIIETAPILTSAEGKAARRNLWTELMRHLQEVVPELRGTLEGSKTTHDMGAD